MQYDLKKIKKNYGEKMAHLCGTLFPSILETEGLLYSLLESKFAPSRFLYDDIVENNLVDSFKDFIFSLLEIEEAKISIDKTPKELLDEAGYDFYECKTVEDGEKFKKYYCDGEVLCTFNDIEGRLNNHHVFFAVKKNVDEIKREDFSNPNRQDEYGTSVISIQFTKGYVNTISIKNRYNHTVLNPDATFSNNLDNIIEGLTESFEQTYNLNINGSEKNDFEIPGYVKAADGKFYKYNYEINDVYYCPDNIIIDHFVVCDDYLDKGRYLVFDYFILDMKEKTIELMDATIGDNFVVGLLVIDKIEIKKEGNEKYIYLEIDNEKVMIVLNKQNKIISYKNNLIREIGSNFLYFNRSLISLYLENVKAIGDNCLFYNDTLKLLYTPNVERIDIYFLYNNLSLDSITMPRLMHAGSCFIAKNENLSSINLPMLKTVKNYFLPSNLGLMHIDFPNLEVIGDGFLILNKKINNVNMPNLFKVGEQFLYSNNSLETLSLPRLKIIGEFFMEYNNCLKMLELPSLESTGSFYLRYNRVLSSVIVPDEIWDSFIYNSSFKYNFISEKNSIKKIGTR